MKDEYLKRANDYLKNGFGALVGFELKDGVTLVKIYR